MLYKVYGISPQFAEIGVIIKVAYLTGASSANGNMQLTGLSKSSTIVLGCQFAKTSNDKSVVAIPYTFTSLTGGSWGCALYR